MDRMQPRLFLLPVIACALALVLAPGTAQAAPSFESGVRISVESEYIYTGSDVEPVFTVTDSQGNELTRDVEYTAVLRTNWGIVTSAMSSPATYILSFIGVEPYYANEMVSYRIHLRQAGWERLAGQTRYSTMSKVLGKAFDETSRRYAVVASGKGYADALAASALAGKLSAPIIITSPTSLSPNAAYELRRIGAEKVIVVGGQAAVSAEVEASIRQVSGVSQVQRVAGANRYETARLVYEAMGKLDASDVVKGATIYQYINVAQRPSGTYDVVSSTFADEANKGKYAVVASGGSWPDALSVSPFSYVAQAPIFLANKKTGLDDASRAALAAGGFETVLIVGGTTAVPDLVEEQLAGANVKRIAGDNRYATSVAIAQFALDSGVLQPTMAVAATGRNFPDALTGSALSGTVRAPLLLVGDASQTAIEGYLKGVSSQLGKGFILGGTSAVSEQTQAQLEQVGPAGRG